MRAVRKSASRLDIVAYVQYSLYIPIYQRSLLLSNHFYKSTNCQLATILASIIFPESKFTHPNIIKEDAAKV
jgi:hypothetical protein